MFFNTRKMEFREGGAFRTMHISRKAAPCPACVAASSICLYVALLIGARIGFGGFGGRGPPGGRTGRELGELPAEPVDSELPSGAFSTPRDLNFLLARQDRVVVDVAGCVAECPDRLRALKLA